MQQHTRRLAFFFIASMLTGVAVLVACDTDNAVQPLPGGGSTSSSSGKPPGTSGSQGDDDDTTNPGDDDDDVTDAGTGTADCGTAPRLRKTELGFFCGFFRDGGPDSGGASNCANDETCCNPGKDGTVFPPSFCAAGPKNNNGATKCENLAEGYGSTWVATGSTTWECGSATNCGGRKCCAYSFPGADAGNYINVGKFSGDNPPPASCNAQTIYKIAGTKCATACKEDKSELELCSLTDDCPQGKTCLPARGSGSRDLGYCK